MKYKLLFVSTLIFIIGLFIGQSYAQSADLTKRDPYKGERIRITGTGWKPYEKIIIEFIRHTSPYSGMVLTPCGEAYAFDDGSFGGTCLIPPNLGYNGTVDIYVNGIKIDEINVR